MGGATSIRPPHTPRRRGKGCDEVIECLANICPTALSRCLMEIRRHHRGVVSRGNGRPALGRTPVGFVRVRLMDFLSSNIPVLSPYLSGVLFFINNGVNYSKHINIFILNAKVSLSFKV